MCEALLVLTIGPDCRRVCCHTDHQSGMTRQSFGSPHHIPPPSHLFLTTSQPPSLSPLLLPPSLSLNLSQLSYHFPTSLPLTSPTPPLTFSRSFPTFLPLPNLPPSHLSYSPLTFSQPTFLTTSQPASPPSFSLSLSLSLTHSSSATRQSSYNGEHYRPAEISDGRKDRGEYYCISGRVQSSEFRRCPLCVAGGETADGWCGRVPAAHGPLHRHNGPALPRPYGMTTPTN